MPDEEFMLADDKFLWFSENRDIKFFLKVIEHPQVMIPCEEIDRDAGIAEVGKFAEKANVSFGDRLVVLKPKVEQVADEINAVGID